MFVIMLHLLLITSKPHFHEDGGEVISEYCLSTVAALREPWKFCRIFFLQKSSHTLFLYMMCV